MAQEFNMGELSGVLDSIRNQTENQWKELKTLGQNQATTAAVLEGVALTLERLEGRINNNEKITAEYTGDRKIVKFLAWVIGIVGLGGAGTIGKNLIDGGGGD